MAKKQTEPKPEADAKVTALVTQEDAELLRDDIGAGREDLEQGDIAIPRLAIVQSLSPQLNKQKPEYNPDAGAGDIINTVDGALYPGDQGVDVVVATFAKEFIEWRPRKQGGGLIANHGNDPTILKRTVKNPDGQDILPDSGNEIVTTMSYGVLIVDPTGDALLGHPAVISMAKTNLKHARRFNTLWSQQTVTLDGKTFPAPIFYRVYKFRTVMESNDKGDWFVWHVEPGEPVLSLSGGAALYNQAKAFAAAWKAGAVRASQDTQHEPIDDVI